MGISVVLRPTVVGAARAARGLFFLERRSFHLAPVGPLFMKGMLSRGGPTDIPFFRLVARFASSVQKKSAVDAELFRIVESEIECAKEECGEKVEVPDGFPFEIQDEEGTNSITLRRDYLGENIEVVVSMPSVEESDVSEEVGSEENQGDDEKAVQPTFPLTVNISKGEKWPSFEFRCTAYADEIVIDSLCIRGEKNSDDLLAYEGPAFDDLDENLQKAFHKYLEARGISPATARFLYEFLVNKDDREYLLWLQNMKYFLDK